MSFRMRTYSLRYAVPWCDRSTSPGRSASAVIQWPSTVCNMAFPHGLQGGLFLTGLVHWQRIQTDGAQKYSTHIKLQHAGSESLAFVRSSARECLTVRMKKKRS